MHTSLPTSTIPQAVEVIRQGGVIAYPTEAVFGLGCDPDNEEAVQGILDLKQRSADKGLIIIASEVKQLEAYVDTIPEALWQKAISTWPGPVTWLMPARPSVSKLLTGQHNTIAVRVTGHPVARALCEQLAKPIVSTSANKTNRSPALSVDDIYDQFDEQVRCVVAGEVDTRSKPSEIRDLLSDKVIRG